MNLLKNANILKTINSVKHKLICPTVDNNSLFSFDSFIIFCIEVSIDVSYTFSKLSLTVLLSDIVILFLANKNIVVMISLIIVTKLLDFAIFLSEYFPIKVIVITCYYNEIIIIEENKVKSFNTIYTYNGTNCLSII